MSEIYKRILAKREAEEAANREAERLIAEKARIEAEKIREEQRIKDEQRKIEFMLEEKLEKYAVYYLSQSPAVKELVETFKAISEGEWDQPVRDSIDFQAIYHGDEKTREVFPLLLRGTNIHADKEKETVLGNTSFYLGVRNKKSGLLITSTLDYVREREDIILEREKTFSRKKIISMVGSEVKSKLTIGIITFPYRCKSDYDRYNEEEFMNSREEVAKSMAKAIEEARAIDIKEINSCDCHVSSSPSCHTGPCCSCNCGP